MLQEALVDELLLDLAELHGTHAAAVGGEVAGGFGFEAQEDLFGDMGGESSEELLFDRGQVALEILKIQTWARCDSGMSILFGALEFSARKFNA